MLSAERITENWEIFLLNIESYLEGDRREKLLDFYRKYEDRFALMPASGKASYHNAFAGGYVDHVNRVLNNSFQVYDLWEKLGADVSGFSLEELAFVAINHDLGKFGDIVHEEYLVEEDNYWIKKGQIYKHNPDISFMKTSERSLFLLQQIGVPVSNNEYLGIKLHDGLYEEANKSYYMSFSEEYRLRSNLPYIVHHADLLAIRVEHDSPGKQLNAIRNKTKEDLSGIDNSKIIPSSPVMVKQNKSTSEKPKSTLLLLGKPSPSISIKDTLPLPAPKPWVNNKYSALLKKL